MDLLATFGDRLDGKKRVLRTLMSFHVFQLRHRKNSMIQPAKYMRLSQCPLRVAAVLLEELQEFFAVPLPEVERLIRDRLGDGRSRQHSACP